jgi:hypothetical protein
MAVAGTPYSVALLVRTEVARAFDGFPGATISDRMLAAVEEVERLREADEAIAADRDAARSMLRRFADLFRDGDGDVVARPGASVCDDLLIETMDLLGEVAFVGVLSPPEPETGGSDIDHFRQATADDITDEMVERACSAAFAPPISGNVDGAVRVMRRAENFFYARAGIGFGVLTGVVVTNQLGSLAAVLVGVGTFVMAGVLRIVETDRAMDAGESPRV